MIYSRRDFVKLGSFAVGLVPALTNFGFGRANFTADTVSLQNYDSFRKLISSEFAFYKGDSCAYAVLTEVKQFETPEKKVEGECFSMVFEMPSDDFVQDTYKMHHPSIGMFDLLSVPGKSEKGAPLLISVINRL